MLKFTSGKVDFDPQTGESVGLWNASEAGSRFIVPAEALIVDVGGDLKIVTKKNDRSNIEGEIVATQFPYIENIGTITELIKRINNRGRPLEEKTVLKLAWGVLCGVDALHRAGGVHRDLKSKNILITAQVEAKVIDFDMSKVFDPENRRAEVVGTPNYMAPEAMLSEIGDWPISDERKIDSFSLGITLFEIMTGKLPWTNEKNCLKLQAEYIEKFGERRPSDSDWILAQPGIENLTYSPELMGLLANLTDPNPDSRISIKDARKVLRGMLAEIVEQS